MNDGESFEEEFVLSAVQLRPSVLTSRLAQSPVFK